MAAREHNRAVPACHGTNTPTCSEDVEMTVEMWTITEAYLTPNTRRQCLPARDNRITIWTKTPVLQRENKLSTSADGSWSICSLLILSIFIACSPRDCLKDNYCNSNLDLNNKSQHNVWLLSNTTLSICLWCQMLLSSSGSSEPPQEAAF